MVDEPHVCPLCGTRFTATDVVCHPSCPLSAGCHLICCPTCGYQTPDEDQLAVTGMLKRLWLGQQAARNSISMEADD